MFYLTCNCKQSKHQSGSKLRGKRANRSMQADTPNIKR